MARAWRAIVLTVVISPVVSLDVAARVASATALSRAGDARAASAWRTLLAAELLPPDARGPAKRTDSDRAASSTLVEGVKEGVRPRAAESPSRDESGRRVNFQSRIARRRACYGRVNSTRRPRPR